MERGGGHTALDLAASNRLRAFLLRSRDSSCDAEMTERFLVHRKLRTSNLRVPRAAVKWVAKEE